MSSSFSWKEIIHVIPGLKPKSPANSLYCLSFDAIGIYSAYLTYNSALLPQLQWCEFTPYVAPHNIAQTLKNIVAERQLQNINCSWILQRSDYKLLTIEALPVKPEELAAAIRWNIKDLVNTPLDKTLIDFFPAPFALTFGKPNNLQIVATEKTHVQAMANIIEQCGLNLSIIDIPELALRNITRLFAEDKEGLGLLWINSTHCKFIITKNENLYSTRDFDVVLTDALIVDKTGELTLEAQRQLEALALEIQRSLAYYRSKLKQTMPVKLLVSELPSVALNYLSNLLTAQVVEILNLSNILNGKNISPKLLSTCLVVIGGALRKDIKHAATN